MSNKIVSWFKRNKVELIFIILITSILCALFFINNMTFNHSGDDFYQYRTYFIMIMDKIKSGSLSSYLDNIYFGTNLTSLYYYFPLDFLSLIKIALGLFLDYDLAIFLSFALSSCGSMVLFYLLLKDFKIKEIHKVFFSFAFAFLAFGTFLQYFNFLTIAFYFVLLLLVYKKWSKNNKIFLPLFFIVSINITLTNIYMAFVTFFMSNLFLIGYKYFFVEEEKKVIKTIKELFKVDVIFILSAFASLFLNLPFLYQAFFTSIKRAPLDFLFFFPLGKGLGQYLKLFVLLPINGDVLFEPNEYVFSQGTFYIGVFSFLCFSNAFFSKEKRKFALVLLFEFIFTFFPIFALFSNAFTNYYSRYILFLNTFNILLACHFLSKTSGEILILKRENTKWFLLLSIFYFISAGLSFFLAFFQKKQIVFYAYSFIPLVLLFTYRAFKNKAIIPEIFLSCIVIFSNSFLYSSKTIPYTNEFLTTFKSEIKKYEEVEGFKNGKTRIISTFNTLPYYDVLLGKGIKSEKDTFFHSFINSSLVESKDFLNSDLYSLSNKWSGFNENTSIINNAYFNINYLLTMDDGLDYLSTPFYQKADQTDVSSLYVNDYAFDYVVHPLSDLAEETDDKGFDVYQSFGRDEGLVVTSIDVSKSIDLNYEQLTTDKETYVTFDVGLNGLSQGDDTLVVVESGNVTFNSVLPKYIVTKKDGSNYMLLDDSFVYSSDIESLKLIVLEDTFNSFKEDFLFLLKLNKSIVLTSLSLSSLTDGLDKQKGFEGLVDVSLSQDHLSLKVDETKLNGLGLSDTENYFISLPYLYDDGWGEEAFSYHGFLAFHIKDLEVDYRVKGAKLGAIISASSFISLPILYFIVVHHDKKKKRKKELVIEVNSASNLSETNDTNLYTFEEENAFNKGPSDKKKVKYLVVIKDKKKKDKTL